MSETSIMRSIQIAISRIGARVFRNQVGKYKLENGAWLSSGLVPGSSDLIGWTPVTITPGMVGRRVAVFTAIEVKRPKEHLRPNQADFLRVVSDFGGIAIVGRSDSGASACLKLAVGIHGN